MVIGAIAEGIARGVESVVDGVSAPFAEPAIRLGVTGLSRAGKTVFITGLVANLMDRGRMPQLRAAASGAITAAWLQPQPDDTVARFDFEGHMARLTGPEPVWPEGTRAVSELRLSLKVAPRGLLGGLQRPRTLHLDIVDYPGEWLLDLGLMDKTYAVWSADVLARAKARGSGRAFEAALALADGRAAFDETVARGLAEAWAEGLAEAREAGFSDCLPGRFLLPGELAGSPVLTFAPLPPQADAPRGSLWRECARRFEAYKKLVVKPFFRDHFARIDRQVVLVDVLDAIHAGPRAIEDLRVAMGEILAVFRPGRNAWLARLLGGRRVERILFAATKADHLHHVQHPQLMAITAALLRDARDRADFAGARTEAISLAGLRATVEDMVRHEGADLPVVRGRRLDTGGQAAFWPGRLPEDPAHLLAPAREGAERWLEGDYAVMRFAPARLTLRPGEGPPHIRLDKAAEFLIGDRL